MAEIIMSAEDAYRLAIDEYSQMLKTEPLREELIEISKIIFKAASRGEFSCTITKAKFWRKTDHDYYSQIVERLISLGYSAHWKAEPTAYQIEIYWQPKGQA